MSDSSIQNLTSIVESLEINFRKLGYLEDANESYYLKSVMKGSLEYGFAKVFDRYIMRNLLGYLVRPWRIMWWSFFMILAFSGFYFFKKNSFKISNRTSKDSQYNVSLAKGPPIAYSEQKLKDHNADEPQPKTHRKDAKSAKKKLEDSSRSLRPSRLNFLFFLQRFHSKETIGRNIKKLGLSLMLSLSIFFKFPPTAIFIPKEIKVVRFLAWFEWFLGLIMVGLFLKSLSRTEPILNDLISKLF